MINNKLTNTVKTKHGQFNQLRTKFGRLEDESDMNGSDDEPDSGTEIVRTHDQQNKQN